MASAFHWTRTTVRIIDANLNRAREAFRVMEEYARLGLEDASLALACKEARHELMRSVPDELAAILTEARDIVGDVGCANSTDAEMERADELAVVVAAGKRASEALRTIEEYAKTGDRVFAGAVEQIRYKAYELERRLAVVTRASDFDVRLYVLLTESLCQGDWFATAEAALRGGADCIQLREKNLPDGELLRRARRLVSLCHDHGAKLIVNDRPDIATASGADGVHVGQDDLPVCEARRMLRPGSIVGVSTHTASQVAAAVEAEPDYIAVGPIFATSGKPDTQPVGVELLTTARGLTARALVAIGGITAQNAGRVLGVSRCAVCICRAVIAQPDVERAAASLRALVDATRSEGHLPADSHAR